MVWQKKTLYNMADAFTVQVNTSFYSEKKLCEKRYMPSLTTDRADRND